jgi:hypothetical protein
MRLRFFCLMLSAISTSAQLPQMPKAPGASPKRGACRPFDNRANARPSQAPPFEAIARKFAHNPETLAFALRDPHPRMNVVLMRSEMDDVAAYINSLAK